MSNKIYRFVVIAVALLCVAGLRAQDAKPEAEDVLPRLIATLDAEPLALIAFRNSRDVAEKFSTTTLARMIGDPQYERGAQFIESRVTELLGGSLRASWPAFSQSISGPVVLAILPAKVPAEKDKTAPLRVVFLVQVNEAPVADLVKQQWPSISGMVDSLVRNLTPSGAQAGIPALFLSPAELKTAATNELPPANKLPEWVARAAWPKGDVLLRARPMQICATARPQLGQPGQPAERMPGEPLGMLELIDGSGVEALAWGLGFNGELTSERLTIDLAEEESVFKKFASALRDNVSSWEGIMAATQGDVDAAVLVQSDLTKLGGDLPYLFQSVERYLRGKRWAKVPGMKADALDPARFKFLMDRMQGSFSLVAKPGITGELRLTVTSSIKAHALELPKSAMPEDKKANDTEVFREELMQGLTKLGAVFETLVGARKIGGALPLGAAFHGRGQFAAPVIGLSAGWVWLCSSSVAYQDLTDAFKQGKTLGAREKKRATNVAAVENAAPSANNPAAALAVPAAMMNEWSAEDALRLEVNLDRVLKIGYAAWLLSSNEGPTIAGHKVPSELLPPPQVFGRVLGKLRASANRSGSRLECRSTCVFPGVSWVMLGALQDASESIGIGRRLAAEVAAARKAQAETDATADKNAPEKPAKEDTGKPAREAAPAKDSK